MPPKTPVVAIFTEHAQLSSGLSKTPSLEEGAVSCPFETKWDEIRVWRVLSSYPNQKDNKHWESTLCKSPGCSLENDKYMSGSCSYTNVQTSRGNDIYFRISHVAYILNKVMHSFKLSAGFIIFVMKSIYFHLVLTLLLNIDNRGECKPYREIAGRPENLENPSADP